MLMKHNVNNDVTKDSPINSNNMRYILLAHLVIRLFKLRESYEIEITYLLVILPVLLLPMYLLDALIIKSLMFIEIPIELHHHDRSPTPREFS